MMDDISTSSWSRDVWTASDTEKVVKVVSNGKKYNDVDELRSALHKYDISIPPSRPVDQLESVALCILQHAAASFQVCYFTGLVSSAPDELLQLLSLAIVIVP